MPSKCLIRSSQLPYHVTARANNREAFHLATPRVWKVLTDQCFESTVVHEARIHGLVLMPNHFHLLITVPEHDLGVVMEEFMRSVTKMINLLSGRSGRAFGGPYHWTLVDSTLYFAHVYKYVLRNPVRAKLCPRVEDYPYGTLSAQLGQQHLRFPLHYPFGLGGFLGFPDDPFSQLDWLNRPFRSEQEQAIRKAFRRLRFQPPKSGWKRNQSALDEHPF